MKKRPLRIALTLLFTGLALAYLVWKIDFHQTVDILADDAEIGNDPNP